MTYSELSDFLKIQIEQAASGCIGGTLKEWPLLNRALQSIGYNLPPDTNYLKLSTLSQQIIDGTA